MKVVGTMWCREVRLACHVCNVNRYSRYLRHSGIYHLLRNPYSDIQFHFSFQLYVFSVQASGAESASLVLARRLGYPGCGRNVTSPTLTLPGMSRNFLYRRDSWKYGSNGRRLALAGHCRARLVLILLLMGRQVFSTVFGKKVSSDPSGNVTGSYEVKWIYTFYEGGVILIVGRLCCSGM